MQHFLLLGSIYISNFREFIKRFGFANFLHFLSILAVFLAKKCQNRKKVFYVAFPILGKHLLTKFQKISTNGLDIANFLHFLSIWLFFNKKDQKRPKSKIGLCGEFSFTKWHLHTKFQKISSNGLSFGKFFFWPFFVKKRPKKAKIENWALW